MKGPLFFLIQYAGQLISYGRSGIFILQTINLCIALFLICEIFSLCRIRRRKMQLILLAPILYIAGFTLEGGNLTEEFSLIPLLSCLLLSLSFFRNHKDASSFRQKTICSAAGLWFGISFGALLMIRVTNAALICAMLFSCLVILIRQRKIKQSAVCMLMFITGASIAILPVVLYCRAKGILSQMLEAVFVLGFRYSQGNTFLEQVLETAADRKSLLLLLVFIPCVLILILKWRNWEERLFIVIGTIFTLAAVSLPLLVIGEAALFSGFRSISVPKRIICGVLVFLMLGSQLMFAAYSARESYFHLFHPEKYTAGSAAQDIAEKIPETDRNNVFGYNINPSWYTYTGLFPGNKYCGWQNHYIALMPGIYDELNEFFQKNAPAWLVLPNDHGILPDFLESMIDNEYKLYYSNKGFDLFNYSAQ